MKRFPLFAATAVLCLLLVATASARLPMEPKMSQMQELTEKTLLSSLGCENCGIRSSATYMLGDLKIRNAVIPLMGILKGAADEQGRILAALSLCKIGDARGLFAVKRAVTFDSSPRVRELCAWYYNQFVQAGTFEFGPELPSPLEQISQR